MYCAIRGAECKNLRGKNKKMGRGGKLWQAMEFI